MSKPLEQKMRFQITYFSQNLIKIKEHSDMILDLILSIIFYVDIILIRIFPLLFVFVEEFLALW